MDSKPVYRTANAPRASVEGMNMPHRCLDVTVAIREILPYVSLQGSGRGCPLLRVFFQFPITFSRVAWSILDCARRTSTFLSCAFREQEDDQTALLILLRPRVARAQEASRHPHSTPPQIPPSPFRGVAEAALYCAHRTSTF